jgi:hypothetical protein
MKPKQFPYFSLFNKWRLVIAALFGILIYFWALFFLPGWMLEWITTKVQLASRILAPVFPILGTSTLAFIALLLVGEPLPYGSSRQARFYQDQFPSRKIAKAQNTNETTATMYFLAYYDCWQFDSEPEHVEYLQTTQLRFWCLVDFLGKRLLLLLLVLSGVAICYELIFEPVDRAALMSQGAFVFLLLICVAIFRGLNKLPSESKSATGCWKAWSEQNDRNYLAYVQAMGKQSPSDFHIANQARLRALVAATK